MKLLHETRYIIAWSMYTELRVILCNCGTCTTLLWSYIESAKLQGLAKEFRPHKTFICFSSKMAFVLPLFLRGTFFWLTERLPHMSCGLISQLSILFLVLLICCRGRLLPLISDAAHYWNSRNMEMSSKSLKGQFCMNPQWLRGASQQILPTMKIR